MNTDFPRIITFLRKERGLSQKQVASDMGISQALLSHYEKGIRECGLDFLVKTAEYYEVSCDYLLGRTVERSTSKITVDDITKYMHLDSDKSKDGTLAYSFDATENGFANNSFELIKCNYGNIQNYVIGVDIIDDVSICVNMLLNNNLLILLLRIHQDF